MRDRADRRLLLALAASVLLHASLMQAVEGVSVRRTGGGAPPLNATLMPQAAVELAEREMEVPPRVLRPHEPVESASVPRVQTPVAPTAVPAPHRAETPGTSSVRANAAYPQVNDPTYYTVLSLDVYPKALSMLDWRGTHGASKVRATVLIDEAGVVNDVRGVQAASPELENAAREWLLRTVFTPAYKDGRVVKAQVLVSLE